jgi:hypothetical protein
VDGLIPAVRVRGLEYVASSLPLAGKEEGKRAQAEGIAADRLDALP